MAYVGRAKNVKIAVNLPVAASSMRKRRVIDRLRGADWFPICRPLYSLSESERNLIKERAQACLATARAPRRAGHRKPKLNEQQVRGIRARLRAPDLQVAEVARRYGVAPLYKHVGVVAPRQ
ncbi:hypothetical protein AB870_23725 (plasmid) [Pandoraea faecigallinarum]|uniref:Uncharacterized protein n=1 Tax=Pandoraea faecigallinarum TaxID=656179 RepID=A0A173H053_9BURK|nr:hypothetical protein AB870_23725 [Pandoraea faecigallinarum]